MDSKPKTSWLSWVARVGLILGAATYVYSPDYPYWEMELHAPQYPKGLHVYGYPDRIAGDVKELDGLNHYIGMRELGKAAQFERSIGRESVYVMAGLMVLAVLNNVAFVVIAPLAMAVAIMLLEIFVALLQAYIFAMLSSVSCVQMSLPVAGSTA